MRNEYYKFLNETKIINYLDNINVLSYSKKLKILKNLKNKFSIETINNSLVFYKNRYIDVNRINLLALEKMLFGICKIYEKVKNEQKRN